MIPPYQPPFGDFYNTYNRGDTQNHPRNYNQGPTAPPPRTAPIRPTDTRGGIGARAVDPSSIRNCIGRNTYVWLDNGQEFWMFPIQVGRRSVSGFRWTPRFGWSYTGISLDRIDFFTCV